MGYTRYVLVVYFTWIFVHKPTVVNENYLIHESIPVTWPVSWVLIEKFISLPIHLFPHIFKGVLHG